MKYSLLDDTGLCVNCTVWDGTNDWQPPEGQTLVPGDLQIGSRYEQDPNTDEWVLVESPTLTPPTPESLQLTNKSTPS
jgi:hypothetical protein